MEKVKVTRDQAEAIEINRKVDSNGEILNDYFGEYPVSHWSREAIRRMNIDDLVRALYIGYEVEPEFKVGQAVIFEYRNNIIAIGEIIEVEIEDGIKYAKVNDPKYSIPQKIPFISLRHASPSEIAEEKERRWWANIGREVKEYKLADVIRWRDGIGLYEVVSSKPVREELTITSDFGNHDFVIDVDEAILVIPVENRLDVNVDE